MVRVILLFSLFAISIDLTAQQHIQGLIQDTNGKPLGFAHTYNETLEIGQVSNINGKFQLLARKGDSIRFSYIGYNSKSLVVESIHLTNYIKVELTEDSLLLPSITIFSDPYYKVPINFKGETMNIPGIEKSEKSSGPVGGPSSGGVGLTLYGPITFFSKDAKEQRKAELAYENKQETIFYQKFIESDSVKEKLCKIYDIDSATFDRIIVSAHLTNPEVQKINKANDLWYWLLLYFKDQLPNR
mgnify:CR=1 FL=1